MRQSPTSYCYESRKSEWKNKLLKKIRIFLLHSKNRYVQQRCTCASSTKNAMIINNDTAALATYNAQFKLYFYDPRTKLNQSLKIKFNIILHLYSLYEYIDV